MASGSDGRLTSGRGGLGEAVMEEVAVWRGEGKQILRIDERRRGRRGHGRRREQNNGFMQTTAELYAPSLDSERLER